MPPGDAIERRGRLVGDDQVGQPDHDARNGDALLLAADSSSGQTSPCPQAEQAQQMARAASSHAGSLTAGVVETPAMTFWQRRQRDDSEVALLEQEAARDCAGCRGRLPRTPPSVGAQQAQLALGRPAHGAEEW